MAVSVAPVAIEPKRQNVIQVEHLWAGYDQENVLEDVTLHAYPLDFIGIIGPNGGGKNHPHQGADGAAAAHARAS